MTSISIAANLFFFSIQQDFVKYNFILVIMNIVFTNYPAEIIISIIVIITISIFLFLKKMIKTLKNQNKIENEVIVKVLSKKSFKTN